MDLSFDGLTAEQKYKLISASVIPRPVALITSLNQDGTVNAAPFSAFNYVSDDPPLIVVGMQPHAAASSRAHDTKDTCRNILRTEEFVVNFVDEALAPLMAQCAADFPSEVSEVDVLNIETTPACQIDGAIISSAPVAMECRLWRHIRASPTRSIIFGEIVSMRFATGIVDPVTLRMEIESYRPVGRLFASQYIRLTDTFAITTPTVGILSAGGAS